MSTIHEMDIIEFLKDYDGDKFHAVLSDPPYGLAFMGKTWDKYTPKEYQAWVTEWASLLINHLHDGAVCMFFGGTRTYHRLATGLEDAGFDIFDSMMYVYGSGFPKSHNIYKQLEKNYCVCDSKQNTQHEMRSMSKANISQTIATDKATRQVLQQGMSEQNIQSNRKTWCKSKVANGKQSGMERWGYIFQKERELQRGKIRKVSKMGIVNGTKRQIRYGTPIINGDQNKQTVNTNRSGSSHRPQSNKQQNNKFAVIPKQLNTQESRTREVCNRCNKPIIENIEQWNGYGTALKPAYEPIVLCRKPRSSTYANIALENGTGALNIDGGRIGTNDDLLRDCLGLASAENEGWKRPFHKNAIKQNYGSVNGRFPANFGLICECEQEPCECVESELDKQSGVSKSTGGKTTHQFRSTSNLFSQGSSSTFETKDNPGLGDKGGASRFFYTAKASRKERNAGLGDLPDKQGLGQEIKVKGGTSAIGNHNSTCENCGHRKYGEPNKIKCECKNPKWGIPKNNTIKNNHPTVKPLKLTEYLAKLLLPPIENSRLLIPFSGSGSEMIGANLAGWSHIEGIELNSEYIVIAEKRLDYWEKI